MYQLLVFLSLLVVYGRSEDKHKHHERDSEVDFKQVKPGLAHKKDDYPKNGKEKHREEDHEEHKQVREHYGYEKGEKPGDEKHDQKYKKEYKDKHGKSHQKTKNTGEATKECDFTKTHGEEKGEEKEILSFLSEAMKDPVHPDFGRARAQRSQKSAEADRKYVHVDKPVCAEGTCNYWKFTRAEKTLEEQKTEIADALNMLAWQGYAEGNTTLFSPNNLFLPLSFFPGIDGHISVIAPTPVGGNDSKIYVYMDRFGVPWGALQPHHIITIELGTKLQLVFSKILTGGNRDYGLRSCFFSTIASG
jgi:hypothetical protein